MEKYIAKFELEGGTGKPIKDLKNGLDVLKVGTERAKKDGVEGILKDMKYYTKKGKRVMPGLGLSRGFGEFLWQGYDWQREIMEAVHEIEDYFGAI